MFNTLQTLIYPHKCIVCRKILDKASPHICPKCALGLLEHHVCQRCGRPYAINEAHCLYCKDMEPIIKRMISIFPYQKAYKKAVLRWKYQGIRKYGLSFAQLLFRRVIELEKIDAFIPVPLSKDRYRQRGFNQALDLANRLSGLTGTPVLDILERYRTTKPQSVCTKEERKKNIKHTIRLKKDLSINKKMKKIAIIDDIYTTGATINECVRAIIETYHEENIGIYVIVVAIAL